MSLLHFSDVSPDQDPRLKARSGRRYEEIREFAAFCENNPWWAFHKIALDFCGEQVQNTVEMDILVRNSCSGKNNLKPSEHKDK